MPDLDELVPWNLAVNKIDEAMDAVIDVAILTGNHASEGREAVRYLRTALILTVASRERERLHRNAMYGDKAKLQAAAKAVEATMERGVPR